LFALSKVKDAHPHRFRDTFAVDLLLSGVPIEHVSILLGHQSVRITERHYAPWVRSRQEQLEADLANAWKQDPLIALQRELHARYTADKPPLIHFTVRILEARVGIEPIHGIENTQVVDSTWGQNGEKGQNGESLYNSVQFSVLVLVLFLVAPKQKAPRPVGARAQDCSCFVTVSHGARLSTLNRCFCLNVSKFHLIFIREFSTLGSTLLLLFPADSLGGQYASTIANPDDCPLSLLACSGEGRWHSLYLFSGLSQ
jgi:hypothetical protein